jgi:uncharacterized protein (UPF0261 family)
MKAYVIGTCDTKGRELAHVQALIEARGVEAVLVDVGTRPGEIGADVPRPDVSAQEVARHHPDGPEAVFSDDRGQAVAAMAQALRGFLASRTDVGGVIGLGGSGGTALITPAMRDLPVGVPKVMVSTVASGNVAPYVGPADIMMLYSVTDVSGINRISRAVLGNAAHALAGMVAHPAPRSEADKPALGLTMFGVTTPCVEQVSRALEGEYDCLVFHATGTGGRSMEKLVDSGLIGGVIDITTTEICDLLVGGVFPAGEDRFDSIIRTRIPYVASCGALDMVNFGAKETVPEKFLSRNLYVHNPQVTLMRTTVEENVEMGRCLIPEGGVSLIDAPGKPFHDPAADEALFQALEATVRQTPNRRLIRLPHAINDPEFAKALVREFRAIAHH